MLLTNAAHTGVFRATHKRTRAGFGLVTPLKRPDTASARTAVTVYRLVSPPPTPPVGRPRVPPPVWRERTARAEPYGRAPPRCAATRPVSGGDIPTARSGVERPHRTRAPNPARDEAPRRHTDPLHRGLPRPQPHRARTVGCAARRRRPFTPPQPAYDSWSRALAARAPSAGAARSPAAQGPLNGPTGHNRPRTTARTHEGRAAGHRARASPSPSRRTGRTAPQQSQPQQSQSQQQPSPQPQSQSHPEQSQLEHQPSRRLPLQGSS